ncbi:MAG: transglycosylase SLT domain-containing protein [Methylophilaceae bacterium]
MIKFLRNKLPLILVLMTSASTSYAAAADQLVLKARKAFDKENNTALLDYTKQLQAQNHLLTPYAEYWNILLNITETDNQTISNFLTKHNNYGFAKRLRTEYLKKLGSSKDWAQFSNVYADYQSEDTAVACYAAEAYQARPNTGSLAFAKPLWLAGKSRPKDCDRLFDRMKAEGVIDEKAIWARFRMALGANKVGLAKSIVKRSKGYRSAQQKTLRSVSKSPSKFLKKRPLSFNTRFGREVYLYALIRLAKKDSWKALPAFQKIKNKLKAEEVRYFYGMLGLSAAKRHEIEAGIWFQKADFATLNHEQMSWYARATLRQKDWASLLGVIEQMPPLIAEEARWRYWKARALIARKQNEAGALDILLELAPERHYYGWIAQDELAHYKPNPLLHYKPTQKEVNGIEKIPGVQRAEALLDLDLRWEGKREWLKAIKGLDDKQLLAAAAYANRKQWYDLAINTADDTREHHDFSMRYLMPYEEMMKEAANVHHVDESWVHGITRQESRFMHYAKSHAGAAGLMQLMPTTARWAAKRAGVSNYKRSMIHDLDTNITIGTYYLSDTLNAMKGNKVMATAGYNAGPSRAKKWQASRPLEGAIYAETIPFNETRVYVQRVMANTHMYANQIGRDKKTLKQRMGTVPAKF